MAAMIKKPHFSKEEMSALAKKQQQRLQFHCLHNIVHL